MVDLSSLRGYDRSSHQVTEDFRLVPKGKADGPCLPDDLAEALGNYLKMASDEQITALQKSLSKGVDFKDKIVRLKSRIKKQAPDAYAKMQPIFQAYAPGKGGVIVTPKLSHQPLQPQRPQVSSPEELKQAISLINRALGSELRYIESLSMEDLTSFMPPIFIASVSRKDPFTEAQIHSLADLIQSHPHLFTEVDGALIEHVQNISRVLNSGSFERAKEASASGVYMGSYKGKKMVVVKPQAEELKGPYNPRAKGYLMPDGTMYETRAPMGTAIRNGFVSGEGSLRERDAYVTDLNDGLFSKTPPTLLVKITRRAPMVQEGTSMSKICSIQAFVEGKTPKKSELSLLSQEGLERVAYADIDEGNADRHLAGNLFMTTSGDVQRIDQGMTRGPEVDCCEFGWMDTYQVSRPMMELSRKKIAEQKPEIRRALLESLGVSPKAIELELARIEVKKSAAKLGLTFYDIGVILTPVLDKDRKKVCEFENILKRAEGSKDLKKEIDAVTTSIRDWKVHIASLHASNPREARKTARKMIDHPSVYRALARHLEVLGGK